MRLASNRSRHCSRRALFGQAQNVDSECFEIDSRFQELLFALCSNRGWARRCRLDGSFAANDVAGIGWTT